MKLASKCCGDRDSRMLWRGKRKRSSVAPRVVKARITGWGVGCAGGGGGGGGGAGVGGGGAAQGCWGWYAGW